MNRYPSNNNTYTGLSLDVGASYPQTDGLGLGLVYGRDKTQELFSFNIFDVIDDICIRIMEE